MEENKKLKIFFIKRYDGVDYDEYDSAVVVSCNEEDAVNLLKAEHGDGLFCGWGNYNITITEVTADKPKIVIESFNAG
jgi:hypothetical protein